MTNGASPTVAPATAVAMPVECAATPRVVTAVPVTSNPRPSLGTSRNGAAGGAALAVVEISTATIAIAEMNFGHGMPAAETIL
jgi:hypothetical protein